eukprot:2102701-Alexandrium_andersonii.AAC.1
MLAERLQPDVHGRERGRNAPRRRRTASRAPWLPTPGLVWAQSHWRSHAALPWHAEGRAAACP